MQEAEAAKAKAAKKSKNSAIRGSFEDDLEMDMAEAWVHEHGKEDADERSGDLEAFFKAYERLTGGNAQNGVMKGLEAEFCGWERYTKGFGSRLLEAYGYEKGLGLGSRADGIIEPVKAFKYTPGRGLDYINTAKVKSVYKQDADVALQLREAAQQLKDATGEAGDEEWQGAFKLASSINVSEDGSVMRNTGRVTSFDEWKKARAEERKLEKAVDNYNSLTMGEKVEPEKKKTKQEVAQEEALEEAQNQRLRVAFLQKRMKDAQRAFERNRHTDRHIASQAKAIVDECKAELGDAHADASVAESKMHLQMKKNKKFKF